MLNSNLNLNKNQNSQRANKKFNLKAKIIQGKACNLGSFFLKESQNQNIFNHIQVKTLSFKMITEKKSKNQISKQKTLKNRLNQILMWTLPSMRFQTKLINTSLLDANSGNSYSKTPFKKSRKSFPPLFQTCRSQPSWKFATKIVSLKMIITYRQLYQTNLICFNSHRSPKLSKRITSRCKPA